MHKRNQIILSISMISLVLVVLISSFLVFRKTNENFLYPEPIWIKGLLSDMVVENDEIVHFLFTNTTPTGINNNVFYGKMDLSKNNLTYIPRTTHALIGKFFQVKINLDSELLPFIYLYGEDGYSWQKGDVYSITNKSWIFHPLISKTPFNCSTYARRAIINSFVQSNNLILSFIYSPPPLYNDSTPLVQTPVIYNTTSKTSLFMHTIFPEIQTYLSLIPGRYIISNAGEAILWTRLIDDDTYNPYLGINWKDEGWRLYSLGNPSPPKIPISILSSSEGFDVFYYEDGYSTGISKIYYAKITNSTQMEIDEIFSFNGNMVFHGDSLCKFGQNYYFLYTKQGEFETQRDLYLGKYNTTSFIEKQLTESTEFREMYAQLEISQNYFHFLWSSERINDTLNQTDSNYSIYYNRIKLTRESELFRNGFSKKQINNIVGDGCLERSNIFFLLPIPMTSQTNLKRTRKVRVYENF